jgi:hypothetical protein
MLEFLRSWFEWVNAMPSSIAIRESQYGYIILLSAHALSMAFFAGLIAMMDLRLVGAAFTRTRVTEIQRRLFPWQMATLVVVVITGVALLYGQPLRYFGKILFWGKLSLMAFAGVNAMAFHYTTYKSVAVWDNDRITPFGARLAGALSLVLWAGVVILGRLTAYNWLTYE